MARRRIDEAQVDDAVLEGGLAMVQAGAARLMGDVSVAMAALAAIDRSVSPDFGFQVTAEKARLAWRNEDYATARELYAEAAEAADSLRYPAVSVALRAEERSGPAETKTNPLPAEGWAQRQLEQELTNSRPSALVVRLVMSNRSYESYLEMGERVEELVEANPHLGVVEGLGTVDDIWELFVNGEDPDALLGSGASPDERAGRSRKRGGTPPRRRSGDPGVRLTETGQLESRRNPAGDASANL